MRADATHATGGARALRAATAVLLAVAAVVGFQLAHPSPADATSYRFWTYWTGGDGGWTFATVGASRVPADGSVEGWRFAISAASSSASPPRTSRSFDSICGSMSAAAGSKRVALVVDYGTTTDAPPGDAPPDGVVTHCALVATSANGYAVLDEFTSLRVEGGLVCGIGGYPARGCGEVVSDPPTQDSSGGDAANAGQATGGSGGSGSTGADDGSDSSTNNATPPATSSAESGSTTGGVSHPSSDDLSPSTPPMADPTGEATPVAAGITSTAAASPAGSPVGAVVGIVAVGALGVIAWLVARRRRTAP